MRCFQMQAIDSHAFNANADLDKNLVLWAKADGGWLSDGLVFTNDIDIDDAIADAADAAALANYNRNGIYDAIGCQMTYDELNGASTPSFQLWVLSYWMFPFADDATKTRIVRNGLANTAALTAASTTGLLPYDADGGALPLSGNAGFGVAITRATGTARWRLGVSILRGNY